eukprot:gnl/TRDRNA2_/TRDRNA2_159047_c0_seq1.p2 gnl/TRDRNA2_/TRDRNA2_159047_c0~~gnl/TRDRNA2_/TRDRNA2_159047_c0_seq1.p2  ORF type:complete len:135 (-),score=24.41 gnl/TRDRNA2_/TRDRNA2_159047_c0_seq1:76-480(-)
MGWGGQGKGDWGYGGWTPVMNWMDKKWVKPKAQIPGGGQFTKFKDEQKVWIGNIPTGIGQPQLLAHMKQAGNAVWCESFAKTPHTGVCCYATAEEAQAAIGILNGSSLGGKALQVDFWARNLNVVPKSLKAPAA